MATLIEPEFSTKKDRSAAFAIAAFPVFILVGSAIAFIFPAPFLPLTQYITCLLYTSDAADD